MDALILARTQWPMVIGMGPISLATPWVSASVRERWFSMPELILSGGWNVEVTQLRRHRPNSPRVG
jgi:hypothetical protein